jgi:SpoVK/Ycf46/Vps4 family AAA+-type ATPase
MNSNTFLSLFIALGMISLAVRGQDHCNDGDHVCKLIQLHTSGMLTFNKLTNVTRTLDSTLHRAIGLEINVGKLNQQVSTESQLATELRVRLENEATNRKDEIQSLLKKLDKSQNRTMLLEKELEIAQNQAIAEREKVRQNLTSEIVKVNKTISREANKQTIERRKIADLEATKAKWLKEREVIHRDEEREKLVEQDVREKKRENMTRKLGQEKIDYEDTKIRDRTAKKIAMEETSALRREEERRKTEEALQAKRIAADLEKAKMDQDTAAIKAKAEAEGRILQERQNKDIHMERLAEEGKLARQKWMDAINLAFKKLTDGFNDVIFNPTKLGRFIGSLIALAAGVYAVRDFSRVAADEFAKRLGKPSLIRETSRQIGVFGMAVKAVRQCFQFVKHLVTTGQFGVPEDMELFDDVVLNQNLRGRVDELARSTRYARKNRAPYRHVLFYGPAGTGKSMVAKRMALFSGMDWAIMTGGDVGPLGAQAVTDLHEIFKWAKSSNRGLVLFIDEAEAFLGSRSRSNLTEHMRNALNALLYQTGDQSEHFMLILATNRPSDLDTAILDRVDEAVFFDIPEEKERVRLSHQYFNEHLLKRTPPVTTNCFSRARNFAAKVAVSSGLRSRLIQIEGFDDEARVSRALGHLPSSAGMRKNVATVGESKEVSKETGEGRKSARSSNKIAKGAEGGVERVDPRWTVKVLKSHLNSAGLDDKGKKSELQERLQAFYDQSNALGEEEEEEADDDDNETAEDVVMEDVDFRQEQQQQGIALCMSSIGGATSNFSGRQIAKLMISMQGAVYGTKDAVLDPELLGKVTSRKISENKRKREMAGSSADGRSGEDLTNEERQKKRNKYNYA